MDLLTKDTQELVDEFYTKHLLRDKKTLTKIITKVIFLEKMFINNKPLFFRYLQGEEVSK
jgi:hypothetical protein